MNKINASEHNTEEKNSTSTYTNENALHQSLLINTDNKLSNNEILSNKEDNESISGPDTKIKEDITKTKVLLNLLPNISSSFIYFFVGIIESHFIGQTKDTILLDGIGL